MERDGRAYDHRRHNCAQKMTMHSDAAGMNARRARIGGRGSGGRARQERCMAWSTTVCRAERVLICIAHADMRDTAHANIRYAWQCAHRYAMRTYAAAPQPRMSAKHEHICTRLARRLHRRQAQHDGHDCSQQRNPARTTAMRPYPTAPSGAHDSLKGVCYDDKR